METLDSGAASWRRAHSAFRPPPSKQASQRTTPRPYLHQHRGHLAGMSPPPTSAPTASATTSPSVSTAPTTSASPPSATPSTRDVAEPEAQGVTLPDAPPPPSSAAMTPRTSKRILKRKAEVAARSAERRKKLARPASGRTLDEILADPPAAPEATTRTPVMSNKAAGKKKAGSAARAARLAASATAPALPKSRSTPAAQAAGNTPLAPPTTNGPAHHPVIYLDSPPLREDIGESAAGVNSSSLTIPQMLNQGDDAATFDLASFLDSTSGTSASPPTLHAPLPSTTTRSQLQLYQPAASDAVAQLAAQVGSLSAMVMEMRDQMLTSSARPTPSLAPPRSQSSASHQAPTESPVVASWTIPAENGRGLPPPQLRELRTSSFPTNVGRGRGDYIPHPTHILAAYRSLPGLHKPNGEFTLPTDTLLGFRSAFDLPFDMTIPTASGLYGVRIGSQGLSLSLFRPLSDNERLARSSSNANFSIDFNSNVQPPQNSAKYSKYDEILLAISGLTAFSNKFWYPHMHDLLDQLRRFVTDNQSADPGNTPERVLCTLHFANRYLGRAVGHLADDSPTWWRDFWTATDAIEYRSIEWLLALQSLPAPRPVQAPAHAAPTANMARRSVPNRAAGMPEDLRKLVPRRSDGTEPCLRFFGGGMCFGGTRDRCAFSYRTHRWEEPLHRDLQAYINKLYGSNRRGHAGPRRN